MLDAAKQEKILQNVIDNFKREIEKVTKKMELVRKIEESGLELVKSNFMPYEFEIKREDLPSLRKAVGRIKVGGKTLAWNYDRTGDIIVTVTPVAKEFSDLFFQYRTKLRGNKCRVEEHTGCSYKTLVCSA